MRSVLLPQLAAKTQELKRAKLYCDLLDKYADGINKPHELIKAVMSGFEEATADRGGQSKKSLRGSVFEYAVGEALIRAKIVPIYYQAQVRHVPLARFDWLLYHPKYPVSISCKTSARERWKQAAFEGMALKQVYPQAKNYLVLIERIAAIDKKKEDAPQTIDHYVIATEPEFDEAIADIAKTTYSEAKSLSPISHDSILIC